jgi:hypothetical protein
MASFFSSLKNVTKKAADVVGNLDYRGTANNIRNADYSINGLTNVIRRGNQSSSPIIVSDDDEDKSIQILNPDNGKNKEPITLSDLQKLWWPTDNQLETGSNPSLQSYLRSLEEDKTLKDYVLLFQGGIKNKGTIVHQVVYFDGIRAINKVNTVVDNSELRVLTKNTANIDFSFMRCLALRNRDHLYMIDVPGTNSTYIERIQLMKRWGYFFKDLRIVGMDHYIIGEEDTAEALIDYIETRESMSTERLLDGFYVLAKKDAVYSWDNEERKRNFICLNWEVEDETSFQSTPIISGRVFESPAYPNHALEMIVDPDENVEGKVCDKWILSASFRGEYPLHDEDGNQIGDKEVKRSLIRMTPAPGAVFSDKSTAPIEQRAITPISPLVQRSSSSVPSELIDEDESENQSNDVEEYTPPAVPVPIPSIPSSPVPLDTSSDLAAEDESKNQSIDLEVIPVSGAEPPDNLDNRIRWKSIMAMVDTAKNQTNSEKLLASRVLIMASLFYTLSREARDNIYAYLQKTDNNKKYMYLNTQDPPRLKNITECDITKLDTGAQRTLISEQWVKLFNQNKGTALNVQNLRSSEWIKQIRIAHGSKYDKFLEHFETNCNYYLSTFLKNYPEGYKKIRKDEDDKEFAFDEHIRGVKRDIEKFGEEFIKDVKYTPVGPLSGGERIPSLDPFLFVAVIENKLTTESETVWTAIETTPEIPTLWKKIRSNHIDPLYLQQMVLKGVELVRRVTVQMYEWNEYSKLKDDIRIKHKTNKYLISGLECSRGLFLYEISEDSFVNPKLKTIPLPYEFSYTSWNVEDETIKLDDTWCVYRPYDVSDVNLQSFWSTASLDALGNGQFKLESIFNEDRLTSYLMTYRPPQTIQPAVEQPIEQPETRNPIDKNRGRSASRNKTDSKDTKKSRSVSRKRVKDLPIIFQAQVPIDSNFLHLLLLDF